MKINRIYEYDYLKQSDSIEIAIEKMNNAKHKILFVIDDEKTFVGTVTDGDIRRYLQKGKINLKENLENIYNHNPKYIVADEVIIEESELVHLNVNYLPVLDKNKKISYILHFNINFQEKSSIKNKVIIMAGGKGTRLLPLTRVIPKPLVPYNDKTIIEKIMEQFIKYGFKGFTFTINYKKEMIKNYFANLDYRIDYIEENEGFLGTAGSLSLLDKNEFREPFFVSNCDVLIDADYKEIMDVHKKNKTDITVIATLEENYISYGVIESDDAGNFLKINEKPNTSFLVNTGIYIFDPKILNLLEKNQRIDMPDLISECQRLGYKIKVFAVPKKMKDIGQWEYYKKTF